MCTLECSGPAEIGNEFIYCIIALVLRTRMSLASKIAKMQTATQVGSHIWRSKTYSYDCNVSKLRM